MPGQCLRMPSWTAPTPPGLEAGVSSSLRTWMCTSEAPASNASWVDSICSAVEIGTAGLSFLRGTEPVKGAAMKTGFMAKSLRMSDVEEQSLAAFHDVRAQARGIAGCGA